jgi:hypothetical protein
MNNKRTLGVLSAALLMGTIMVACTENAKAKINMIFKDAPKAGIAAKINGEEITEEQLVAEAQVEMMQIKKQEYDLKMSLLNKMVSDRVLGAEAKKDGLASAEEYIGKKVLKGEIKISDADYKKFVKEKNIPESNINDQVKERIYAYMKEQKRDELYAEQKLNRLGNAKTRGAPVGGSSSTPTDMFAGEDLAIARKRERAEANTIA